MGMLDMKITQDMLNYWKKVIPSYQFAHYTLDDSFEGTLYYPSVISIGPYAFSSCTNLVSINLPVTIAIGQYAFCNCNNLTSINLPVTIAIGPYAFCNCNNLTSINLPLATTIEQYAFGNCTNLATVTLGSNLSSIATDTFLICNSLTTINVIGDENCTTAQTLATLTPAQYHNATIVYNYTPPSENESENDSNDGE